MTGAAKGEGRERWGEPSAREQPADSEREWVGRRDPHRDEAGPALSNVVTRRAHTYGGSVRIA